jgi:kynurenine formamidase
MEKYRLIDLSLPLKAGGGFTNPAKIHYLDHERRGTHLAETLGISLADIGNRGNSFEEVAFLTTHSGTHIDAPWHYTPVVAGEKAMTIDEVPLEWCWGGGVKLDIPGKEAGEDITARELQEAAEGIRYRIKPGDIVLIHTGVSRYYGQADCDLKNPGVTREGTHWLADQGVKVVGIDSPCWDRPPRMMLDEIRRGVKGKYMQGHRAAGERGMCILEWLTNLDLLPPFGFQVAAFPVKIERASGSWTRAVAFLKN